MSKCLDPQNICFPTGKLFIRIHNTPPLFYIPTCQLSRKKLLFFHASKKKKEKVNEVKKSVYGQLCICILFHAFAASSNNIFPFLNKQKIKNNKIHYMYYHKYSSLFNKKLYFFPGTTQSNNHQCVIPYKDFLIAIKHTGCG